MRCQQCWDHRCIRKNCKCDCHVEYDKQLDKNTKKFDEILKEEQNSNLLKKEFEKND